MYLSPTQSQALANWSVTLGDPAQTSRGPRCLSPSPAMPAPFSASPRAPQVFNHTLVSSPACEPCKDLDDAEWGSENVMMTNDQINELVKHKPGLGHIHQRCHHLLPLSRARVSGGPLPRAQGSSMTLTSSKTLPVWMDFIFGFISFYMTISLNIE